MPRRYKRIFRGTRQSDVLTGTDKRDVLRGFGGDDVIDGGLGNDKAWGGAGRDTFVTLNGGRGRLKIMDFEMGDRVAFCGCSATRIEQRGKNAWIVKGDDMKAVLKGVNAEDLEIDFASRLITMVNDPLA